MKEFTVSLRTRHDHVVRCARQKYDRSRSRRGSSSLKQTAELLLEQQQTAELPAADWIDPKLGTLCTSLCLGVSCWLTRHHVIKKAPPGDLMLVLLSTFTER